MSWDMETAEGVGSVPIPGGDPLHNGFHTINYRVADDLTAAVFVPDYELSTEKARQALPGKVAFKDAVHNVSREPVAGRHESGHARPWPEEERQCVAVRRHAGSIAPAVPCIADGTVLGPDREDALLRVRLHRFRRRTVRVGAASWRRPRGTRRIAAEELSSGHWRVLHLGVDTKGVQVERA